MADEAPNMDELHAKALEENAAIAEADPVKQAQKRSEVQEEKKAVAEEKKAAARSSAEMADEEREKMSAELEAVNDEIAGLNAEIDQLSGRRAELVRQQARLNHALRVTVKHAHRETQKAIGDYLKRANEARAARAEARMRALGALGGDTEALQGKAPIDAAHVRNKSRGTQRPQRKPVTGA